VISAKLLTLLTDGELCQYAKHLRIVIDCETILGECNLSMDLAKSIFTQRADSMLAYKNLEWDCIQRINSILDLCHGKT